MGKRPAIEHPCLRTRRCTGLEPPRADHPLGSSERVRTRQAVKTAEVQMVSGGTEMAAFSNIKARVTLSGASLLAMALLAVGPAQAQTSNPPESGAAATDDTPLPQSGSAPEVHDTTEIVVTGSSIRGVPP